MISRGAQQTVVLGMISSNLFMNNLKQAKQKRIIKSSMYKETSAIHLIGHNQRKPWYLWKPSHRPSSPRIGCPGHLRPCHWPVCRLWPAGRWLGSAWPGLAPWTPIWRPERAHFMWGIVRAPSQKTPNLGGIEYIIPFSAPPLRLTAAEAGYNACKHSTSGGSA